MSVNNGSALALGRTPHGVRGLKLPNAHAGIVLFASHPSRGAWIEIHDANQDLPRALCRTPHRVRGLKCVSYYGRVAAGSRTPHGVRGLK